MHPTLSTYVAQRVTLLSLYTMVILTYKNNRNPKPFTGKYGHCRERWNPILSLVYGTLIRDLALYSYMVTPVGTILQNVEGQYGF
jgi:hypothetical protein